MILTALIVYVAFRLGWQAGHNQTRAAALLLLHGDKSEYAKRLDKHDRDRAAALGTWVLEVTK